MQRLTPVRRPDRQNQLTVSKKKCVMIYLSRQNILFLKPQKVAGTSFEIALSKFAGPDDIITPITEDDERTRTAKGFAGPRNYLVTLPDVLKSGRRALRFIRSREREERFYNHIPAKLARTRLGPDCFDRASKISIVRNPYDFLVSVYFWRTREMENAPSFEDWIRANPGLLNFNTQFYAIDDKPVIDFFIRYENAEEDIRALEKNHAELEGLSKEFSSLSAKGGIRPKGATPAQMFQNAPDLVAAVRFFNKDLIDRFGYTVAT